MKLEKIIAFKRLDDGEMFTINKNGTFSLDWSKKKWPDSYHSEYTASKLLNTEGFQVIFEASINNEN